MGIPPSTAYSTNSSLPKLPAGMPPLSPCQNLSALPAPSAASLTPLNSAATPFRPIRNQPTRRIGRSSRIPPGSPQNKNRNFPEFSKKLKLQPTQNQALAINVNRNLRFSMMHTRTPIYRFHPRMNHVALLTPLFSDCRSLSAPNIWGQCAESYLQTLPSHRFKAVWSSALGGPGFSRCPSGQSWLISRL